MDMTTIMTMITSTYQLVMQRLRNLFTQSRSGCHGADGTGGYGGPDLLGQTTDHIADYIWNGKGNMPAFPDYTDQDVADIITHIRVLEDGEQLCSTE